MPASMSTVSPPPRPSRPPFSAACLALLACLACSDGDTFVSSVVPPAPPLPSPPAPIETERTRDQGLPGLVIRIESLTGGSGAGGNFRVGDRMRVRFTIELDDGTPVAADDLDFGGLLVSGPTTSYQRVIERQRDLPTASTFNTDGTYTYVMPPIPAAYLPPENDTPAFGAADGELQGQALLDGTYTLGIEAFKSYTIEGVSYRDATNTVQDFLFGAATQIEGREVVTLANCNQCHGELRAHGTIRRNVTHCLLCHTAGAEDENGSQGTIPGTPGVTIDFRVMIHKIHNGAHLPSVQGVSTDAQGYRVYDANAAQPYEVVGRGNVHDYSHVSFPVFPNVAYGLPRDVGYQTTKTTVNGQFRSLTSQERGMENAILTGAASCEKCHGDPDGAGPLQPPAQGSRAYDNPSRLACGSCHDDVDWARPYRSNTFFMPQNMPNSTCTQCHAGPATILPNRDVHAHPLLDPANPKTVFRITAVRDVDSSLQAANNDGRVDPGEALEIDVEIEDGQGQALDPSMLARVEFAVTGPTTNRNILEDDRFPPAWLSTLTRTGTSVTTTLPQPTYLERIPVLSTSSGGESFQTARWPHWNVAEAETQVWVRKTGTPPAGSGNTTLLASAARLQNYLEVNDTTGFAKGEFAVVDDGMSPEEYVRIQWVDTTRNRLWLSSIHGSYNSANGRYQPWLRSQHSASASVVEVTLTALQEGVDYDLDAAMGTIQERSGVEFGAGSTVVVSYVTDFVMPTEYPPTINDSDDLGASQGKWTGLPLVDGTYTVGIWGEQTFGVEIPPGQNGEVTSYNTVSEPAVRDFLVGPTPKALQPINLISSAQNCYACHDDLWFHGSHRRGVETCVMCHGAAGAEDAARYVWPVGAETSGVSIEFRRMVHKLHMGRDLTNASTYEVVGFNGNSHFYDEVVFPVTPGATAQCAKCHGATNTAWELPADRSHGAAAPAQSWMVACGSCHDSNAAQAHIAAQTAPNGVESCQVCHDRGDEHGVERMHRHW